MKRYCVIFFLICITSLFFVNSAMATWEYLDFSGSHNKITTKGVKPILKQPYPADWGGFGKELKNYCLCTKETEQELGAIVKKHLGSNKFNISSGLKHSYAFKNSDSLAVEIYRLDLEKPKNVELAYNQLKKLNKGPSFAFMKTSRSIYLAKRTDKVPPRAFIHFVRGYDDSVSYRDSTVGDK